MNNIHLYKMIRHYVIYNEEDHCYTFDCPHCNLIVQVLENEVNCKIFRHGILKSNGNQVNPHASKEHCQRLIDKDLVYGCCKPFKLSRGPNGTIDHVDVCNYI